MQTHRRKSSDVEAWRLPYLGKVADEPAPYWVVERMMKNELKINAFGGFSLVDIFGDRGCVAGDYVLLTAQNTIEFCKADDFDTNFVPALQS